MFYGLSVVVFALMFAAEHMLEKLSCKFLQTHTRAGEPIDTNNSSEGN